MHRINTLAVLQFWAYCFCGYAAFLAVYAYLKQKLPRHAQRWMRFLSHARRNKRKIDQGVARWWPIIFATFCCSVMVYGVSLMESAPIAEEHNVAILAKVGSEWRMRSDEEGEFVYRPCPDFDNESVIWVGYIADRAKWREYGRCKSIRETGFGFYYRVGHNDWRTIN